MSLVRNNRFKVYAQVCELLDGSVTEDVKENTIPAQEMRQRAERLAELYKVVYAEDFLSDLVKLYQGWSREEKEKKVEADRLVREGTAARGKSEYQPALEKYSAALQSYTSLADRIGEGQVFIDIGIISFYLGKYQEAEEYFKQALSVYQAVGHRMGEGKALNSIGIVRFSSGEFRKAEEYYQQYLDICMEVGDRKEEGKASNNIGLIYFNLGQYRKAVEYYQGALRLRQETGDKRGEGFSLQSIAGIYNALGQYQKAIKYQEQALEIFREIGDKRRYGVSLNNMGDIYLYMDQYEQALEYLQKALDLGKEVGNKEGQEISMNNLGYVYSALGQHERAIEYLEQSLGLCREIGDRRGESFNLIDLGSVYSDLDQPHQALDYCLQGLQIASSLGVPQVIWPAQMRIGSIYEKTGLPDSAYIYYSGSIETIESMREALDVESLKTHFFSNKIHAYHSMISLLAGETKYEEAFNYTEQAKARALLDLLSLGRIDITEGVSPELLDEKKEMEKGLYATQRQLSDEYARSKSERDSSRISAIEKDLAVYRSKHEEILRAIEMNHPRYATLTGIRRPLTLDEVQSRILGDKVTFIEYLVGEESIIAWVVRNDGLYYEKIATGRVELDSLVRLWRQPFRDVKEGKIGNLADVSCGLPLSHQLYLRLFKPLEKYLKEDDTLIISPDGILHYLPFESLVMEVGNGGGDEKTVFSEYEQARYVVEAYSISYAPSASVLDPELRRPQPERDRRDKLLAFGCPQFERDGGDEEKAGDILSLLIRDGDEWIFRPLPRSEEEVREITRIMKPSRHFLKDQAREEYLKQRAGDYRIIHLATHGILEEKQPLYSRIVLAQDDDPAEDGFLQTYEIFNLDLNADLVVLSACETGLGELSAGEGLIGLTRAFMYAGAQSVIVSLWSVDESTCRLMKEFYRNLKAGKTKAEALRQAKIRLIHTREDGMSYAHPFLWAPFVLVGAWN